MNLLVRALSICAHSSAAPLDSSTDSRWLKFDVTQWAIYRELLARGAPDLFFFTSNTNVHISGFASADTDLVPIPENNTKSPTKLSLILWNRLTIILCKTILDLLGSLFVICI